jgi:hypothetical protein
MNNCRKTELFPKDEEQNLNVSTKESNANKMDISDEKTSEINEKIDLNLIKIVEDIVDRILEKKFPNKLIPLKPVNTPIISKFAFKPITSKTKLSKKVDNIKTNIKRKKKDLNPKNLNFKNLKPNNWIYLGK